jgi:hypothetical protein
VVEAGQDFFGGGFHRHPQIERGFGFFLSAGQEQAGIADNAADNLLGLAAFVALAGFDGAPGILPFGGGGASLEMQCLLGGLGGGDGLLELLGL